MTRTEIRGLRWAKFGPQPPYIQQKRQRGAKAKGLAFERKVGKYVKSLFPQARLGQWIYFEDSRGSGVAQPDIIIEVDDCVHILECKLTYRADAESKLRRVYGALLQHLFPDRRITFTQVFHNFGSYVGETKGIREATEGTRAAASYELVQL